MGLAFNDKTDYSSNLMVQSPDVMKEAFKIFSNKFKNFCAKSPLKLKYYLLPTKLSLEITIHGEYIKKEIPYEPLYNHIETQFENAVLSGLDFKNIRVRNDLITKAVKAYIYDVRLELAPHLPVLVYRKISNQPLTPDEVADNLLRAKIKGKDTTNIETTKSIIEKEKKFVMEQVFIPDNCSNPKIIFSLSDDEGVRHLYTFRNNLSMPFLYKLWNTKSSPEDLGREFFSQIKLISKKRGSNGQ